ncbi:LOW QUALITY PROTEIN: MARVEL domain-containing protein 2-like [Aplochiton taeniatus]
MKGWSQRFKRGGPESVASSSSSFTPTTSDAVPQDSDDAPSTDHTSSTATYQADQDKGGRLKERIAALLPSSLGGLLHRRKQGDDPGNDSDQSSSGIRIVPNGTRVSPPVSPLTERRLWVTHEGSEGASSLSSRKPLLRDNELFSPHSPDDSVLTSIHPAEYYAEKLEVYNLKYSYLKSWPGLLRLLAGLELLFGGMALACVCAYVHKDSEWSNSYGLYSNGPGWSGSSYRGPMTPFILAVLGLVWIITMILLVLGMTMYYRTILLDSPWWPLTEALINVLLFLFYMAAGITYVNDLNRGGLCYMTIGVNPIMANLCRVEGGQMAGTACVFINMLMYFISFLVCLKMWRHEATRREREEAFETQIKPKRLMFQDELDDSARQSNRGNQRCQVLEAGEQGVTLNRAVPSGYVPRPRVIADYVMKYPEISTVEERESYKAVFNDQYQEYKDLHKDIGITLMKFRELDATMGKLLREGANQEEKKKIQEILKKYEQKKNDPSFVEKERCDYLKAKLSHIKNRIRQSIRVPW